MASNPQIAVLPAVRKLAEGQAKARRAVSSFGVMRLAAWEDQPDDIRAMDIEVELRLLSNLKLAASRDAVARLVAEAMGADVGEGAILHRSWRGFWEVWARWPINAEEFAFRVVNLLPWADIRQEDARNSERWNRAAPYLNGVTDPAEALTLIALSVLT